MNGNVDVKAKTAIREISQPTTNGNGVPEDIIMQNRMKLAMKMNSPSSKKNKPYVVRHEMSSSRSFKLFQFTKFL